MYSLLMPLLLRLIKLMFIAMNVTSQIELDLIGMAHVQYAKNQNIKMEKEIVFHAQLWIQLASIVWLN